MFQRVAVQLVPINLSLSQVIITRGSFVCTIQVGKFEIFSGLKVARYSFSGSVPPKFEHKLRRQNRSFGKIATTVVLDKDENLL